MIQLMLAVEEDSQDEDMEEALAMEKDLAVAMDRSLVTIVELQDIVLGTVGTLVQHVSIASPMITLQKSVRY